MPPCRPVPASDCRRSAAGDDVAVVVCRRDAAGAGPALSRRPLAHAIVPAAVLLGGLLITGAALDVSRAITALATDEFTPRPGHRLRARDSRGPRRAHRAVRRCRHGRRNDAHRTTSACCADLVVWLSYVIAVLCLSVSGAGAWHPWPSHSGSSARSSGAAHGTADTAAGHPVGGSALNERASGKCVNTPRSIGASGAMRTTRCPRHRVDEGSQHRINHGLPGFFDEFGRVRLERSSSL